MVAAKAPAATPAAEPSAQDSQVTLNGETFALRYGWRAFTTLADSLGCTVQNVDAVLGNMPVSALNKVLWVGMLNARPEITLEAVESALDADDFAAAQEAVKKAGALFRASMPKKEAGKPDTDPPKAAATA